MMQNSRRTAAADGRSAALATTSAAMPLPGRAKKSAESDAAAARTPANKPASPGAAAMQAPAKKSTAGKAPMTQAAKRPAISRNAGMPKSSSAAKAAQGKPAAARNRRRSTAASSDTPPAELCAQALAALRRHASSKVREGMARYAIPNDQALGVSMRDVKALARQYGRHHALAEMLWQTGVYEARLLACHVDTPAQVTPAQMDRWARDFDNWAHCDTACFALFDRTSQAWDKVEEWSVRSEEFVRRAAFALLASLTVHDKKAADANYLRGLTLIESAAADERNFVKKAVNWALRSIGKRNARLHAAAVDVARRLAASTAAAPRWVGKDALRELTSAAILTRVASKKNRTP